LLPWLSSIAAGRVKSHHTVRMIASFAGQVSELLTGRRVQIAFAPAT
jgi:hypothetical protein